jgi:hypothetical protein
MKSCFRLGPPRQGRSKKPPQKGSPALPLFSVTYASATVVPTIICLLRRFSKLSDASGRGSVSSTAHPQFSVTLDKGTLFVWRVTNVCLCGSVSLSVSEDPLEQGECATATVL